MKQPRGKNTNARARAIASQRSKNRNQGKPIDDGVAEIDSPVDESASSEVPPAEDSQESGGVVAEAEKEVSDAAAAGSEETPAEEAAEGDQPAAESEAEGGAPEEAEGDKTAIEQYAEEESQEPEHQDSGAIEQFAKEEAQEPQHKESIGEYQPPSGEAHDDLIDKYHDALAFGDTEQAKILYKQLQEHRYAENMHRTKVSAQAKQELDAYLAVAEEVASAHPELNENGVESDKVLAISDIYRREGMSPAEALRKAVEDLYPAAMPMAEEPPMQEAAPAAEEPAPVEAAPEPEAEPEVAAAEEPEAENKPLIPDMTERNLKKRNLSSVPTASARNQATPEPKAPDRTSALDQIKKARGQG